MRISSEGACSVFEGGLDVLRQGRIEVVRNANPPGEQAQPARRGGRMVGNQLCHRAVVPGDDDLFSGRGTVNQAGKMGFRLIEINDFHSTKLDQTRTAVK